MTGNKKNVVIMLLTVLVLLPALRITVAAAPLDSETFSIELDMKVPNSNEVYDAQIYLYQVAAAEMDETGNVHMEPVALYRDLNFDGLTQEEIRNVLEELCARVQYPGSVSETTPNLLPLAMQKAGEDSSIHFDHLGGGVYLLMKWEQEEPVNLKMSPVLVYLPSYEPENGTWEYSVSVIPKCSWQSDPVPIPPPTTPDPELPQTGMVQWPVPVLVIAGLCLLVIGYGIVRRGKQD